MENECCSHNYESHCACCMGECDKCKAEIISEVAEYDENDYLVSITTTWLVRADSKETAIDEFSDGTLLDRTEEAKLIDLSTVQGQS